MYVYIYVYVYVYVYIIQGKNNQHFNKDIFLYIFVKEIVNEVFCKNIF